MLKPIFTSALLALWLLAPAAADEAQERRIRSGLKLFRAVLSADEDIAGKVGPDSTLLLLVAYAEDRGAAEGFAGELLQLGKGAKRGKIRKLPIAVRPVAVRELSSVPGAAGVYLAEPLFDEDVARVVDYGVEHGVIVYSPFEGDVGRGVLGGLAIETRVRPYINMDAMRRAGIRIKPFFLKVAKHYEP